MPDTIVNIALNNDVIKDANGNSALVNGTVQVDYTTSGYSGNYSVSGTNINSGGSLSSAGGLTNVNGTYTITDGSLDLTYAGQQPTVATTESYATASAPENPSDTYAGTGEALTSTVPVCFCTGTLIRTARGDVPVEHLMVGDGAVTASGRERPIVWIGHRAIERSGPCTDPVRVRAGAFGGNLPERDLFLSPGHPVLVGADGCNEGGVLVPIMCLINGTTVARASRDHVTYWHVELDRHDVLLAEGLPAESFFDYGNRGWFGEGTAPVLLDPDDVVAGLAGRCRPVAIDGPVLEAERRRLDAIFATGLAAHCAWPSVDDPSIGL